MPATFPILWDHNPDLPSQWFIRRSYTVFPILLNKYSDHLPLKPPLDFNFCEIFATICSGWAFRRTFCWVKHWGWFYIKLSYFLLLYFPKVRWTYGPRDLEATMSKFNQNIGHPSQMEVTLFSSSYRVLKL